jgi:hypothetical protein
VAVSIPLAHVGHWLWVLYLPPILIVAGSILRTTLKERRSSKRSSSVDRTRRER